MSSVRRRQKLLRATFSSSPRCSSPPATFMAGDRTRPILKVQDGCNNRCSYCVIPFVRGRSRSLPPDQAISQIRALSDAGVKEVVLSGINLGSYGRDFSPRVELAGLVQRILDETAIEQASLQFDRAAGCYGRFRVPDGFFGSPGAAFSRAAAIGLRSYSEGHASLVSRRALCPALARDTPGDAGCRDRRRRDCGISGRDATRISARRCDSSTTCHLPICMFFRFPRVRNRRRHPRRYRAAQVRYASEPAR